MIILNQPTASISIKIIEIVVTPRRSLAKEKIKTLFWHNWVAYQPKNRSFSNKTIKIHSLRLD